MSTRERWQIDAVGSQLRFALRHLVVSEIRGQFGLWGGEIFLEPGAEQKSRVDVWVDLGSIDTGEAERDQQLRSPEFLDVARFPQARFMSIRVRPERDGEAVMTGRLDLHGVPRTVEIRISRPRAWIDADQRARAEYLVRCRIDRQDFGLHWNQDLDVGGVVVGDEVDIEARVQLVKLAETTAGPSQRHRVSART